MFKEVISKIFSTLNDINIQYLIERNYENLPYKVDNDIDLLLIETDLNVIKSVIDKILIKYEYVKVLDGNSLGTNKLIYINKNFREDIIRFDLNYMFHYKGISYLNVDKIIENRVKIKEFYIPSKRDEMIMSLFTNYINNGYVKEKYRKDIKNIIASLYGYRGVYFKNDLLNELLDYISSDKWNESENLCIRIKSNIIKSNLFNSNNRVKDYIKMLFNRIVNNKSNLIILDSIDDYTLLEKKLKEKGMKAIDIKNINLVKFILYKMSNSYLFFSVKHKYKRGFSTLIELKCRDNF